MTGNLALALAFAERGWLVFPCNADKKPVFPSTHPEGDPLRGKCRGECGRLGHGYHDATTDPGKLRKWWGKTPAALVGIACRPSGIFVLDVDHKKGLNGWKTLQTLANRHTGSQYKPGKARQKTPNNGMHLIFTYPQGLHVPNNASKLGPGLDLRSDGYICTGPGYSWPKDVNLATVELTEAPAWLLEEIAALSQPKESAPFYRDQPPPDPGEAARYWYDRARSEAAPGNRNEPLFRMGLQLRDVGVTQAEAESLAIQFAHDTGLRGGESEAIRTMQSAYSRPSRDPAGPRNSTPFHTHNPELQTVATPASNGNGHHADVYTHPPTSENDLLSLDLVREALGRAEVGDAEIFAALYTRKVVYDHAERRWYIWAGHYWREDTTGQVYNLVTNGVASQYYLAAGQAQAAGDDETAKELARRAASIRTRKRVGNVLDLATHLDTLALAGEEWDRPGWLLPVRNGVIDLQTGQLHNGQPADYLRAHLDIDWQGLDAPAQRWEQFQCEITNGDQEVIDFKRRLFGCMLAGRGANERIFPILWGEAGQNGKGTELEAIGYVMGNLAATAEAKVLMDDGRAGDRPSPFLYGLRGKRFVWVKESKEGQRFDVGHIKMLTGGDTIEARANYMARNVKFSPTYTVVLMTNNKPHAGDDRAFWRRVCLIPYTLSFVDEPKEPNERHADRELGEKLQAEAAGILAWMVRGCLEWQQRGKLEIPASLQAATEEYRTEEDTLAQFEAERLVCSEGKSVRGSDLYADYRQWCDQYNLAPLSGTAFGKKMGKRHTKHPSSPYALYLGIGLLYEGEMP